MKKTLFLFAIVIAAIVGCIPCHPPTGGQCNNAITIDTIYTTNVVVGQSAMLNVRWNDRINTSWDVTVYNPDGTIFAERINTINRASEFPGILVNTEYRLKIIGRQDTICPPPYNKAFKIAEQGDVQGPF